MIVAGTGTRQIIAIPGAMEYVVTLLAGIMLKGVEKFEGDFSVISGMAEGFDEAMARAAIEARVPWDAYVPGLGYGEYYWTEHSLTGGNRGSEFEELLAQARSIHYTTEQPRQLYRFDGRSGKFEHVNFLRNYDMVDAADKMWVYDKTSRGTRHCLQYAIKVKKPYWEVPLFQT